MLVQKTSAMDQSKDRLMDLTIDKLEIGSIGLVGRKKEVAMLHDILQRSKKPEEQVDPDNVVSIRNELVVIGGYSGVGKTSLAKAIEKDVLDQPNGLFVEGKFDQNVTEEPYSGIAKAFGEICQRIEASENKSLVEDVVKSIVESLGNEVVLLVHLVPELEGILGDHFNPAIDVDFDPFNLQNGVERWKFAIRTFTRVLCSHFSPFVLLLDDCQWADTSSLNALDYMVSDVQNPNPLIIQICFRSNEVVDDSPFRKKMNSLQERQDKFHFNMTDINLESCNEGDVNEIIMSMMGMEDHADETKELAHVCYKRTLGNPFFLIQFMMMLKEEDLITFNFGLLKWVWKVQEIEDATMSTTNVVDLLQNRMRRLDAETQRFAQYAACLGASFLTPTLRLVWDKQALTSSEEVVDSMLALMEDEKLIEVGGFNSYRWVHDKVQEAALSLSDSKGIDELKFEIGTILFQSLSEKQVEDQLFDVVDLINKGGVTGNAEFATLNLKAAKKARSMSGHYSASRYVGRGLHQLKNDDWVGNKQMLLELYTIGVEMEITLGNGVKAEEYSHAIVSRDDFTAMEKLPIQIAMLGKMCYLDMNFDEAIDLALKMLKELDYSMIWNKKTLPFQAISCLMKTVKMAKKEPGLKKMAEQLKPMKDPRHRALMKLVGAICYAAYMAERTFLNAVGIAKMVELTLQYGVDELSGLGKDSRWQYCSKSALTHQTTHAGFTGFGMILVALKEDFELARVFAESGLGLRKIAPLQEGATIFNAYTLVLPWKIPLQSCSAHLNRAYGLAMRSGDVPYAMWALLSYLVWVPYTMGKSLTSIIKEIPKILAQMDEFCTPLHEGILKILYQHMLILASTSRKKELEGDVFSRRKFTDKHPGQIAHVHFAEGEILLFTDIEAAAERAVKHGDKFARLFPGVPFVMLGEFDCHISWLASNIRTGVSSTLHSCAL